MDASWTKLNDGAWGIRVYVSDAGVLAGDDATRYELGDLVDVRSQNGATKEVALGEMVGFDKRSATYRVGTPRAKSAVENQSCGSRRGSRRERKAVSVASQSALAAALRG